MPLIKLATAARRARLGSITAIGRALRAAGVPLVALSPGVFAVDEADLKRFLQTRPDKAVAPPRPEDRPAPSAKQNPSVVSTGKPKSNKRRQ